MKKIYSIFLFLLVMLSINLVAAVPRFETSNVAEKSILIEIPVIEFHKANTNFTFHLHPHNSSDGTLLNYTQIEYCLIHLYKTTNGNHIIEANMSTNNNGIDWEYLVTGGNFTDIGQYAGYVYCQVPRAIEKRGGYFEFSFEVTPTGYALEDSESRFYYVMLFAVFLLFTLFVIIFLKTPYENKKELTREGWAITEVTKGKYVKVLSLWAAYAFFLWFMTIISGMANNYIMFEGLKIMINKLWFFLMVLSKVLNFSIPIILIIMTWKDIVLNKVILKEGKKLIS